MHGRAAAREIVLEAQLSASRVSGLAREANLEVRILIIFLKGYIHAHTLMFKIKAATCFVVLFK